MNDKNTILEVSQLSFAYGNRKALDQLSLTIGQGEVVAVLGPNGSGKSTLFKLVSTLVPVQSGEITFQGVAYSQSTARIRNLLGVVFQAPSLDKKLTVEENLRCQAALYGMGASRAKEQIARWLGRLKVADRAGEIVEKLSGGLARRVEIAKSLLHDPQLLILDEPSSGLDPRARSQMWEALFELQQKDGVTLLVTTHLMDEADDAHRVAILDEGRLVAFDTPERLKSACLREVLSITSPQTPAVADFLRTQFALESRLMDHSLRCEIAQNGAQIVAAVSREFGDSLKSIMLSQAGLEDVFLSLTGRSFDSSEEKAA